MSTFTSQPVGNASRPESEPLYVVRGPNDHGSFSVWNYTYDELVTYMGSVSDAENLIGAGIGGMWWDAQYWGTK